MFGKYKRTLFCCNASPIYRAPSSPISLPLRSSCVSAYEMNEYRNLFFMRSYTLFCFKAIPI